MTRKQAAKVGKVHDAAALLADLIRREVRPLYPANDLAADHLLQTAEDVARIAKVMRSEASGYIDPTTGKQVEVTT